MKPLGRGLESLIPAKRKKELKPKDKSVLKKDSVFLLEIEKIKPNPHQPRKDFDEESLKSLAASIKEYGILQPIIVSKAEYDIPSGTRVEYHLIAGERRLKAAKLAGISLIPAIIRSSEPREKLELALIENIQRKDLNPLERARAYKKLIDEFGLTQKQVSERVGKSREAVANTIRILALPKKIQQAILENKLTEGHARVIAGVSEIDKQIALYQKIISNNLSVRDAEKMVNILKPAVARKKRTILLDAESKEIQEKIEQVLGTKVIFIRKGRGGKIVIEFYTNEDLDNILGKILRS